MIAEEWSVSRDAVPDWCEQAAVYNESGERVATAFGSSNIRLIAHAPELLAALTACVKAWEVNGNAEIPLREARALLDRMGDDA